MKLYFYFFPRFIHHYFVYLNCKHQCGFFQLLHLSGVLFWGMMICLRCIHLGETLSCLMILFFPLWVIISSLYYILKFCCAKKYRQSVVTPASSFGGRLGQGGQKTLTEGKTVEKCARSDQNFQFCHFHFKIIEFGNTFKHIQFGWKGG